MALAFDFVKDEGGIDDLKSYPYLAEDGPKCLFNPSKVAMSDKGAAILPSKDEQKLKEVVAKYGPVSVGIDASSDLFRNYQGGVYDNPKCSSTELDHGVLVVGYGADPKQGDYWIVVSCCDQKLIMFRAQVTDLIILD